MEPVVAGSRLRDIPAFRTLSGARVVSCGGDSLGLVALMLYVADSTGQAMAVSALLLAGDFAPSMLSPFTGAIGDRFDLKRVMICAEITQGLMVLLIALTLPPLPLLLALVALRGIAAQVFLPASRAAVPALVPDDRLERANASLGFGMNASDAIGPFLAAALLPLMGIQGVLFLDAASFFLAGLALATLPGLPREGLQARPPLWTEAWRGLRYVVGTPVLRAVMLGFFAVVACNGIDDVALVLLATRTLGAGDVAVALLLGAVGIGLVAGYALLAKRASQVPLAVLLVLGFGASSLGNFLTGMAGAVGAAFTMQAIRGMGVAAMDVAANTMIQRHVPPELHGRVFGNMYGIIGVAAALAYVGGGLLLDATSAPVTFLVAGTGGLLATAFVALALRPRS